MDKIYADLIWASVLKRSQQMKINVIHKFLITMLIAINVVNAEVIFSDRTQWESANDQISQESFTTDLADSNQLMLDSGITITGLTPIGTLLNNRVSNGSWQFRVYNSGGINGYQSMVIDLPVPVYSFGIELQSVNSSRGITIKGDWDGTGLESTHLFPHFGNTSNGFFGVVGDALFSQIIIDAENFTANGDDLVWSTAILFEDADTIFNSNFE